MNNGANEGYMHDRMQANSNVAAGGSAPSCPRPLGCGRRTWRDRRAGIARGGGQDHARSRAPDRRRCRLHDPRDRLPSLSVADPRGRGLILRAGLDPV